MTMRYSAFFAEIISGIWFIFKFTEPTSDVSLILPVCHVQILLHITGFQIQISMLGNFNCQTEVSYLKTVSVVY